MSSKSDFYMTVAQVADRLGISPSTVTKYYLLIESYNSYFFTRSPKREVLFNANDVLLFERLIVIKQHPKIRLEDACAQAMIEMGLLQQPSNVKETQDMTGITNEISQLKEIIEQQSKQLHNLTEELAKNREQYKIENNQLEKEKKRDENILYLIREMQDMRKEISSSKKKKWWEFWK